MFDAWLRRRTPFRVTCTALVVSAGLSSMTGHLALAQTPPAASDPAATAARAHYQKGTALYDLGKYDEAIAEFEAAYEAKSDPALLYNLAQANRLAGHPDQALHFYRTYLKRVPKPANKAEIESRIAQLEKQLADVKTAGTTPPASGSGTSAPATAAATPPSTPAAPTAPPSVQPSPDPAPSAAAPWGTASPPPPPPDAAPAPATVQPTGLGISGSAPPPASAQVGRPQKLVGIGLMAGGGAFVAGGLIFGAMAVSKAHALEDQAKAHQYYDPNIQSQGKSYQLLQWVCYGVGAAAAATGLVVFLTAPSADSPRTASMLVLEPMVGPNGGGAVLQGVF